MNLTKRTPSTYDSFPQNFNSFFKDIFGESWNNDVVEKSYVPNVDIAETETAYEIDVALPGLKKEDINLEVNNDQLIISGERKFVKENEKKSYKSVETHYGSFKRTFKLPNHVLTTKIKAAFTDGILHVELPKDVEKKAQKVIKID